MKEFYAYHVVTERPISLGQKITFDENNITGVGRRVEEKSEIVKDIYLNPEKYQGELEHHTMVALRELSLEEVRKELYPDFPSRLNCLYVSESLEEAEKWAGLFVTLKRPTYSIVKLKVVGNIFVGDAKLCFKATTNKEENLKLAKKYWEFKFENQADIIKEILVGGEVEAVEIVKEINENL